MRAYPVEEREWRKELRERRQIRELERSRAFRDKMFVRRQKQAAGLIPETKWKGKPI